MFASRRSSLDNARSGHCCDRVPMETRASDWPILIILASDWSKLGVMSRHGIMSHYVRLETITQVHDGKMIPSPMTVSVSLRPDHEHSSPLI